MPLCHYLPNDVADELLPTTVSEKCAVVFPPTNDTVQTYCPAASVATADSFSSDSLSPYDCD